MDAKTIISKYGLKLIEQGGRQGVKPSFGNISSTDAAYIRSHKDEIMAALTAPKVAPSFSDAEIAYRVVAQAEADYRKAEHGDDNGKTIAARDAYLKALHTWQSQYPDDASKSSKVHYNDGATNNPWNL